MFLKFVQKPPQKMYKNKCNTFSEDDVVVLSSAVLDSLLVVYSCFSGYVACVTVYVNREVTWLYTTQP